MLNEMKSRQTGIKGIIGAGALIVLGMMFGALLFPVLD